MAHAFPLTRKLLAGFAFLALLPTVQAQPAGGLIENRGQWPDEVLYMARLPGQTVWVTREALVYDFFEVERGAETPDPHGPMRRPGGEQEATARRVRGHVVALRFEDGAVGAVRPGRALTTRLNYFLGDDPVRHAVNVPMVEEVTLEGLYDGVALRLRPEAGGLALTFEADDPARLARVRLTAAGGEALVEASDAVMATTSLGSRRLGVVRGAVGRGEATRWVAGAVGAGGVQVDLGRATSAGRAGSPAAAHSAGGGLDFSTFLGGTDDDNAGAVALGADGAVTVAGDTRSSDFPTTPGAYDGTFNGVYDAFVARLSADGTSLLYATFLGGTSDDYARAVAVGADGAATVAGDARSSNFPTTGGAYDGTFNGGYDTFVAQLSTDGSSLLYSTFLGGTGDDDVRDVTVRVDGSAIVVGNTDGAGFPATPGAYDGTYNGGTDAFVTRLSADGASLLYSTFLGGTDYDQAGAVALGADGSATVAGVTVSSAFPATPGAYDETLNGIDDDAFVARLSADGASLLYSTFLGGTRIDNAFGVAVGADGSATVTGGTSGFGFPATPGAYDETYNEGSDAFVARLSADGASLLYSTFLGGTEGDEALALAVSADGSATVAGLTISSDFPTTSEAYDETLNDSYDAFVTRLSADGASLLYSTFLGGTDYDQAGAVAVGADGSAIMAGFTESSDFPTTPGVYDETYNGRDNDAFVTALDLSGTVPIAPPPGGPHTSALHGAAPNPFRRQARLRLDIAQAQGVTVRVYDVTGREVARLLDARLVPGVYEVVLDAARLPSGVYLVRATGERFVQAQHVTHLR